MIRFFFTEQFFRFLLVGGLAALINWLSGIALSHWFDFGWVVVIAYSIGMSVAFILNIIFVFPGSDKKIPKQLVDFLLVNFLSFLAVLSFSILLRDLFLRFDMLSFQYESVAHGIAISIPMFLSFLLYKFFAFKGK